jgi:hypothetical protein
MGKQLTIDRNMDLLMLTTVNAREREVADWKLLFKAADERFEFVRSYQPEKSMMWITEARWNSGK